MSLARRVAGRYRHLRELGVAVPVGVEISGVEHEALAERKLIVERAESVFDESELGEATACVTPLEAGRTKVL